MTTLVDEDAFRNEARSFLAATLLPKGDRSRATGDAVTRAKAYQRALAAAGLAGITWPVEYGGRGLPARFQRIFDQESMRYQLPPQTLAIGLGMAGPTILAHGTPAQQQTWIPPMLRGEHVWCELFSEPGSGSDLASVQTRAARDGDVWVVDGQKVWTSGAQYSDFGACLARTAPERPKRNGITMLVVDMHAPGVTVRPLRQITGESHFNEVFLDGVRVPIGNVIGAVDEGWRVARTMLAFERQTLGQMGAGSGDSGRDRRGNIGGLIAEAQARGTTMNADVRQMLAGLRIRQMLLRHLGAHLQAEAAAGRASGGEASILKLAMAQLVQDTAAAGVGIAGASAIAWDADEPRAGRWSSRLLDSRSASIGGGTNEIVRNVIAERVLGLPRDVEVDRDLPFRQLKVGTQHD